MKENVEKALILALIFCLGLFVFIARGQSCECEAPNAVWLRSETETRWIYYTVDITPLDMVGGNLTIKLNLPKNILIYSASYVREFNGIPLRSNLNKLPKDKFHITFGTYLERYGDNNYVRCPENTYWFTLKPLSFETEGHDSSYIPFPLGSRMGWVLFADLGNNYWLQFNLPGTRTIPLEGYIIAYLHQAVICENRVTPVETNPD